MNERLAYEYENQIQRIQPRNSFSDVHHKANTTDSYIADTDIPHTESSSYLDSSDPGLM